MISIVRKDGLVVVNGTGIDGLSMETVPANIHAVQWNGQAGTIEYVPNEHNEIVVEDISSIAPFQAAIDAWQAAYDEITRPPTEDDLKQRCKDMAKYFLAKTDWAVLPDVAIANKAEFETYRQQIRAILFSPVVDPVWPQEPDPVWV